MWVVVWAACTLPLRAQALGGLWSSRSARVELQRERAVVVRGPGRATTLFVQLEVAGDASRFAWLLPVPAPASVEVASNVLFERLDAATAPQYWVEQMRAPECRSDAPAGPTDIGAAVSGEGPGEQSISPHDFLDLNPEAGPLDVGQVASWLEREGFALQGDEAERLGPYLRAGWHLLAFRLTGSQLARAIQPIMVSYESDELVLPLRSGASGAVRTPLQLWIFGASHAVPLGYGSLILNDARLHWLSAGTFAAGTLPAGGAGPFGESVPSLANYADVVSEGVSEADGEAFVTELAEPGREYRDKVWSTMDEQSLEQLENQRFADGFELLWQVLTSYARWDGLHEAVRAAVRLPADVSLEALLRDPLAYRGRAQVDESALLRGLRERVIEPVQRSAERLYQAPYLTRLYTRLSARELSADATFDFNFELGQVSNVHIARQQLDACAPDASWRMQLPQGGVLTGSGSEWPEHADQPASFKIVKLGTTGSGDVVQDNSDALAAALLPQLAEGAEEAFTLRDPVHGLAIGGSQQLQRELPERAPPPRAAARDAAGCSVFHVRGGAQSWLLGSVLLLLLSRRTRRALPLAAVLACLGCGGDDSALLPEAPRALTAVEMTLEQLRDPETCKGCHPTHYREWSGSMHAYAARDPVFIAMNQRGQRETNGQLGDFCVRCHAPMAVIDKRTTDGLNLDQLPDKERGVSCYFCHNVTGIEADHNAHLTIANDTIMRGPIADPISAGVHGAEHSELFEDRNRKSSALCGSCHDIVTPNGVHLERTFEEYRHGIFSKAALGNTDPNPPPFDTCASCHMPGHQGQAAVAPAGAPTRIVHEHLWPGVDLALTDFPHTEAMRSAVEDCQLGSASLSFFKLEVTPPDLFTFQLETNAGHNQPSGAAEDRRLWLEFAAYDASGQLLRDVSSGLIEDGEPEEFPASDPRHDPRLVMFRDRLYDAEGKPVHMFWEAAKSQRYPLGYESSALPVATTTYIEGKHAVVKQYRASGPDGLPARVTARLRMRPIGHDVLHALVESGDLDPAVAARMQTLDFGTQIEWTREDGVQRVISATPKSDCSSYRCLLQPGAAGCR